MMIRLFMKYFLIVIFSIVVGFSCRDDNSNEIDDENLNKEIENARLTEFLDFYFVGNYAGKPSVFRYDHLTDKFKVFWYSDDERVIDLLISPDNRSGYFITKRKQRLKSSQPAIEKGKLYRIDFEINRVESIAQLEEGIQVIPFWMDNDRFTLVINSIDKTIASYINKNTQVYNRFGKLLSDNVDVYDLTKDGYPITKLPSLKYKSPNELFSASEKNDTIFIRQKQSQKVIATGISSKKIMQLGWADNNRHLILLLQSKEQKNQSSTEVNKVQLVVYDLQKKKLVKKLETVGYNRFVLIGDFLIFDNDIGKDSYIEIFKLGSISSYKTIKISGGCGLRNI